jgi:hypothetical protein
MKNSKILLAIVALTLISLASCSVNHGCEAYGQVEVEKSEARG